MTTLVINMDADEARLARMSRRLAAQDMSFMRVPGIAPGATLPSGTLTSGAVAQATAHDRALAQVHDDYVLIMEDDCVMRDDFAARLEAVMAEAHEADEEWDVIHLGARVVRTGPRVSHHLYRLQIGWHAHCYVARRVSVPRLRRWIGRCVMTQGMPFDSFNGARRLVAQPILAVQEPGMSRTEQRRVDRTHEYLPTSKAFAAFSQRCEEARRWR